MSDTQIVTVPTGTRVKSGDKTYKVVTPVTTEGEMVEVKTQKNRHAAFACPNTACWSVQVAEESKVQIWRTGKKVKVGIRCGYCDTELTTEGYANLMATKADNQNGEN